MKIYLIRKINFYLLKKIINILLSAKLIKTSKKNMKLYLISKSNQNNTQKSTNHYLINTNPNLQYEQKHYP